MNEEMIKSKYDLNGRRHAITLFVQMILVGDWDHPLRPGTDNGDDQQHDQCRRTGDVPAHNGLLSRWLQVSIYISPDAALSDRRLRSDRHGDHDEQGDHRTSHPSGICDQCPSDHRGSDCPEEFQTFADPSLHLSGDRYAAVHPEADL